MSDASKIGKKPHLNADYADLADFKKRKNKIRIQELKYPSIQEYRWLPVVALTRIS
jgi:hypothetical protein